MNCKAFESDKVYSTGPSYNSPDPKFGNSFYKINEPIHISL